VAASAQAEAAEQDWAGDRAPAAIKPPHPRRLDRQRQGEAADREDLAAAGIASALFHVTVCLDVRAEAAMAEQADVRMLRTQPRPALPPWQAGQDMTASREGVPDQEDGPLYGSSDRCQVEQANRLDVPQLPAIGAGHLLKQERPAADLRDPRRDS
jgi:hypothetical protein